MSVHNTSMIPAMDYDPVFEYLSFPEEPEEGVENSPPLLFSEKIYNEEEEEIPSSDAQACPTPLYLIPSEPYYYGHSNWSPAESFPSFSLKRDNAQMDMNPYGIDPAVLTGPTPSTSLPSPSNSWLPPHTARDPSSSTAPTDRHIRPRRSRQAKTAVKPYAERSDAKSPQRRGTPSSKCPRRFLATPELVSDNGSTSTTPSTLLTPILPPQPTRSRPRRAVTKPVPAVDDQGSDSEADGSSSNGKRRKASHKIRGSGHIVCHFDCGARFSREVEHNRHVRFKHLKLGDTTCTYCWTRLSRTDSLLRHLKSCQAAHPERHMGKRKGGAVKKPKLVKKRR